MNKKHRETLRKILSHPTSHNVEWKRIERMLAALGADLSESSSGRIKDERIPEGYERLLLDSLIGDPTLFTRADEVRAMWRWADTLLEGWDTIGAPAYPNYAAGSWGPADAGRIFPATETGGCAIGWREL